MANIDLMKIAEFSAYAATVAVPIIAFMGLRQLKLMQQQISTAQDQLTTDQEQLKIAYANLELTQKVILLHSQREAIGVAIDLCGKFENSTVSPHADVADRLAAKRITLYTWELQNYDFDLNSIVKKEVAKQWLDKVLIDDEDWRSLISLLNSLEVTAVPFIKRVADEEIAFTLIGNIFCSFVEELSPLLIALRHNQINIDSGSFENTVALYKCWAAKVKSIEIDKKRRELTEVQANLPSIEKIRPIGYE